MTRYRSEYNRLRARRLAWKAELDKPKSRYSKKTIRAAITAISAKMTAELTEHSP